MKRIIVITGDLAAGKSTVAEILSKRLGILAIEKDHVKERLCDVFGFSNREENKKLSIAAVNEMIDVFNNSTLSSSSLILEANFVIDELNRIKLIADNNEYKMTTICLTADNDLLFKRFCDRIPTRHRAHMSMKLNEDRNRFDEYIQNLRDSVNMFKDKVTIDVTNLTSKEVADKCIEIIEGK